MKKIMSNFYYWISSWYYYGRKYFCPCCNKKFRRLLDFNYKNQIYNSKIYSNNIYKNTICPYCLSLPRHRIICAFLNDNLFLLKNKKVLLFAAEKGLKKYLQKKHLSYLTADLYEPADFKIDITAMLFDDESFDVIFCNHVLEHVENYKSALKELNRILSLNGLLFLSFPVDSNSHHNIEIQLDSDEERKEFYGQSDHYRNFGLDVSKEIEEYGFEVTEIIGEHFDNKIVPVIGPGKYDYNHIYLCKKISKI